MKESDCASNKELIIKALKAYNNQESHLLAQCIEEGRVAVGGCMAIDEQVNEVLMKIVNLSSTPSTGREARDLYNRFDLAITAGRKAKARYASCSTDFHTALTDALHYPEKSVVKEVKRERLQMDLSAAEHRVEILRSRLERIE